jgi:aminopeptidase N
LRPLRYYEQALVPYAFDKLDVVFVPGFPALGFSSPGLMVVQDEVLQAETSDLYLATVFAHELAHGWIGGVTDVSHRDEMWLQEAVVTYLSRTALEETRTGVSPWETASATLPDHAYVTDAEKIRDLESGIGREAVVLGIRTLLQRHAYGTAGKDDFVECWSQASGHALSGWPAETTQPPPPLDSIQ